jgi:hypothetical protein
LTGRRWLVQMADDAASRWILYNGCSAPNATRAQYCCNVQMCVGLMYLATVVARLIGFTLQTNKRPPSLRCSHFQFPLIYHPNFILNLTWVETPVRKKEAKVEYPFLKACR